MKSSEIISDIEEIVKSLTDGLYSKWRIGRVNEPEECKIQQGNPDSWRDWNATSVDDAKEVESYFIDKGMRSEGAGYGGADFVYIFFSGSPQEKF